MNYIHNLKEIKTAKVKVEKESAITFIFGQEVDRNLRYNEVEGENEARSWVTQHSQWLEMFVKFSCNFRQCFNKILLKACPDEQK